MTPLEIADALDKAGLLATFTDGRNGVYLDYARDKAAEIIAGATVPLVGEGVPLTPEGHPAALCPDCKTGHFTLKAAGKHFCDHCEVGKYDAARTYLPNLYAILLPKMRCRARELGYALALHGSMVRDLDLIACPWTDDAVEPEKLAESLLECCGGYIVEQREGRDPATKPHGRLAWSIHLGSHAFIDLSVMPLADKNILRERLVSCHRLVCTPENCVLDGGPEHQAAFNSERVNP